MTLYHMVDVEYGRKVKENENNTKNYQRLCEVDAK